jgi:hypothetical protein
MTSFTRCTRHSPLVDVPHFSKNDAPGSTTFASFAVSLRQSYSSAAPKVCLHFIVVAREIESQHTLLRLENEPPRQPRAAFIEMFPQFPDSESRMCVRPGKAFEHEP